MINARPTSVAKERRPLAASKFATDVVVSAILVSLAIQLTIGWGTLNPMHVGWLHQDPAQHYLGWAFFRDEPWAFPLTFTGRLGYPLGTPIALTDSIPLVAIPLKLISALLPHPFQYIGLFYAISLLLNFLFGLLLARRIGYARTSSYFVASFFLISPIVLWRLHGHAGLSAHWVLLSSLYYYLWPVRRLPRQLPHFIICLLTAAIHAYLVPMTFLVAAASAVRSVAERHTTALRAGVEVVCLACSVLALLYILGTVGPDVLDGAAEGGYRTFSTNLLALIDPQYWPGLLYGGLPNAMPYAGYEYLGLGVISLFVLTLPSIIPEMRGLPHSVTLPLIAVCLILSALAVSARITLGPWVIADIPLPSGIEKLMGIFRVSDRFFWLPYYVILLGIFYVARRLPFSTLALAAALCIQIADLRPMFASISSTVSQEQGDRPDLAEVAAALSGVSHLTVLPMWRCNFAETPLGTSGFRDFGFLALELGTTLNDFNPSRWTTQAMHFHCDQSPAEFLSGRLADDTAYIVSDKLLGDLPQSVRNVSCRRVSGLNLCMQLRGNG